MDLCLLLTSLSDSVIFLHYDSLPVYTIIGESSPISNLIHERNKTRMFYVANVIKFSVLSELLWKSTILVRYKVNSFRPPSVNQLYIRALLLLLMSSNGYK